MKKLLLANIGNRNIKYKGKLHSELKIAEKFKEWTKHLLDNFEEVKSDLEIIILKELLDATTYDAVLIFPTNQLTENKQDQDTIYEAEILKRLIEEAYHIPVDISNEVNCKVADNDALLRFYRKQLGQLKAQYPDAFIEICDAGGTAQMKSSLKIVMEYLFDKEKFKITYVNPDGSKEEVPQIQYRKIIESYQIASLASSGNFRAAAQIAQANGFALIEDLSLIAHYRLTNLWQNAINLVKGKLKEHPNYQFLKTFKQQELSSTYDTAFNEEFTHKNSFFKLCEKLIISEYHYLQKDYTNLVLSLSIFIESFLAEHLFRTERINLESNYKAGSDQLIKLVEENYPEIKDVFTNSKNSYVKLQPGVPLQICFVLARTELQAVREMVAIFKQMNTTLTKEKYSLDLMRNDLAHRGISISEDKFNEAIPHFGTFFNLLKKNMGIPDENHIILLKDAIVAELKSMEIAE